MSRQHDILLHYFDARGRAQFLRAYFAARDIPFEDKRVGLSADFHEWIEVRDDTALTGPFKRLPVLIFDGRQIIETPVIAQFLHEKLGDSARLSDEENYRHSVLLSSLYGDSVFPLGMVAWAELMSPGVDLKLYTHNVLGRYKAYLSLLDQTLADWGWCERDSLGEPMLADCLLWEQLDAAGVIFGEFGALDEYATLKKFYQSCPGRESFVAYIDAHPCQFSGRPGEREALDRIQQALRDATTEERS